MHLTRWIALLLPAAFVLAACSSAPRRTAGSCVLSPADSVLAGGQPLFRDCAVDQEARALNTRVEAGRQLPSSSSPYCHKADVQLVVGVDGRPEPNTIRVITATSDQFRKAVLGSVPYWKYAPAVLDGVPVRQLVETRATLAIAVRVWSSRQGTIRRSEPRNCR